MAEIEAAGEMAIDIDTIVNNLNAELDAALSEEGNPLQNPDHADDLLRSPLSGTSINIYDDASVIEHTHTEPPDRPDPLSYMAFAAMCI